jgi:hypothetical protein
MRSSERFGDIGPQHTIVDRVVYQAAGCIKAPECQRVNTPTPSKGFAAR